MDIATPPLAPIESLTWEQIEAERRAFLERATSQGLDFEVIAHTDPEGTRRFVALCHRARMMVKPAGKPAKAKKAAKAKSLDDILL